MNLKQQLQDLERQKNQQYVLIRRKINNVLLRAGSKKKCIRNNISLENRGLNLFTKGVYDFVSAKSNSRDPVEHIPSRAFPAILSKKHDGEMALISLTDKSIVLAEMCSKGGFNRIPSDKTERISVFTVPDAPYPILKRSVLAEKTPIVSKTVLFPALYSV